MAFTEITRESPDKYLPKGKAGRKLAAPATLAHVNEVLTQIKNQVTGVAVLPASTNLTGVDLATLTSETEARLDAIESKLNALIVALTA